MSSLSLTPLDHEEPPLWRDLLDTTLGYMKWGYGALLLSLVAFAIYRVSQSKELLQWVFGVCVGGVAFWSLELLRRQHSGRNLRRIGSQILPHPHLEKYHLSRAEIELEMAKLEQALAMYKSTKFEFEVDHTLGELRMLLQELDGEDVARSWTEEQKQLRTILVKVLLLLRQSKSEGKLNPRTAD
jgi:hypothetical protein